MFLLTCRHIGDKLPKFPLFTDSLSFFPALIPAAHSAEKPGLKRMGEIVLFDEFLFSHTSYGGNEQKKT